MILADMQVQYPTPGECRIVDWLLPESRIEPKIDAGLLL